MRERGGERIECNREVMEREETEEGRT